MWPERSFLSPCDAFPEPEAPSDFGRCEAKLAVTIPQRMACIRRYDGTALPELCLCCRCPIRERRGPFTYHATCVFGLRRETYCPKIQPPLFGIWCGVPWDRRRGCQTAAEDGGSFGVCVVLLVRCDTVTPARSSPPGRRASARERAPSRRFPCARAARG